MWIRFRHHTLLKFWNSKFSAAKDNCANALRPKVCVSCWRWLSAALARSSLHEVGWSICGLGKVLHHPVAYCVNHQPTHSTTVRELCGILNHVQPYNLPNQHHGRICWMCFQQKGAELCSTIVSSLAESKLTLQIFTWNGLVHTRPQKRFSGCIVYTAHVKNCS